MLAAVFVKETFGGYPGDLTTIFNIVLRGKVGLTFKIKFTNKIVGDKSFWNCGLLKKKM